MQIWKQDSFPPVLTMAKRMVAASVSSGDVVVDATVGNGYDTLFLARLVGAKGKVYGFDIQAQALATASASLQKEEVLDRVELFHAGHEALASYIQEPVQAVMFNLGYLPGADKSIITQGQTTIAAVKAALSLLNKGGVIVMVIYWGHEGGEAERAIVESFVSTLPQKEYDVLRYQFINQVNAPPYLIGIRSR